MANDPNGGGAKDPLVWLAVASQQPEAITQRMQYAAKHYNLVSPATVCGRVPEGCDIVLSVVALTEQDTYNQQGKRALTKVALDKLSAAAGVQWDSARSGRIDGGRDPYYCEFRAIGRVRDLDGTEREIFATKVMDLRDGSSQVDKIFAESKADKDAAATLRNTRAFLVAHAETKARLRAIRSLGIRTSYEQAEVAKPFVVAKLMFHGHSNDPVIRRENARAIRESFLGSRNALYGSAPAPAPAHHYAPPPPRAGARDEEDDDGAESFDQDGVIETSGNSEPAPDAGPPEPTAPPPPAAPRTQTGGPVFRFGTLKDKALASGTDRDLNWYLKANSDNLNDPEKARFKTQIMQNVADVNAEIASRRGGAAARREPSSGGERGGFSDLNGDDSGIPYIRNETLTRSRLT